MPNELVPMRKDWRCEGGNDEFASRLRVYFPNGYGASIVRGLGTYGAEQGLLELAVLRDDRLCYDTPITNDVVGHLTRDEAIELCDKIAALPAPGLQIAEGSAE